MTGLNATWLHRIITDAIQCGESAVSALVQISDALSRMADVMEGGDDEGGEDEALPPLEPTERVERLVEEIEGDAATARQMNDPQKSRYLRRIGRILRQEFGMEDQDGTAFD